MQQKLKAKIINNKLYYQDNKLYEWTLLGLGKEGISVEVEVTINKPDNKRGSNQNRYYWAYLNIISDDTGDDSNSLHEYFKRKLLPPRFIVVMNKEIKIPASTTKLNKVEFVDYIKRIEVLTGILAPKLN